MSPLSRVQAGFAGKRSGEKQHCLAIAAIATLAYFSNLAIFFHLALHQRADLTPDKLPLLYFFVKVRASDESTPMLEFFLRVQTAGGCKVTHPMCPDIFALKQ